jgi:hypothetical protein
LKSNLITTNPAKSTSEKSYIVLKYYGMVYTYEFVKHTVTKKMPVLTLSFLKAAEPLITT